MISLPRVLFLVGLLPLIALADPQERSSSHYRISTEAFASGGVQDGGGVYVVDSSTGSPLAGTGSVGMPGSAYTDRAGYLGQIVDVVELMEPAGGLSGGEGTGVLLDVQIRFDDDTLLEGGAGLVNWSVVNGPIGSISGGGIASTGIVAQDSVAEVSGTYDQLTQPVMVEVLDVDPDNFGNYAGDGIDDDWQAGFFGLGPSGLGAPEGLAMADPDGDGRNNRIEFLSGFAPDDAKERFVMNLTGRSGGVADLELNKVIPGTVYTIWKATGVTDWTAIGTVSLPVEEADVVVQDAGAMDPRSFYRVELEEEVPE